MLKNTETQIQNDANREKKLWTYVLIDALKTLNKGNPKDRREAYEWFLSDKYEYAINSFLGICETLDFDPNKIRGRILELALPIPNMPMRKKRMATGSVFLTAFGETKSIQEWARDSRCNVARNTITNRIYTLKWEHERAITTPALNGGGHPAKKKTSENGVGIENKA